MPQHVSLLVIWDATLLRVDLAQEQIFDLRNEITKRCRKDTERDNTEALLRGKLAKLREELATL